MLAENIRESYSLSYNSDNSRLAVADMKGNINIYKSNDLSESLCTLPIKSWELPSLTYRSQKQLMVRGIFSKEVSNFDECDERKEDAVQLYSKDSNNLLSYDDFDPTGYLYSTLQRDGSVGLYDLSNDNTYLYSLDPLDGDVTSMKFS